jgi:hypothetical protein
MRLWTIQSSFAYEKLKNEKVLRVNEKHVDEDFLEAYIWMNRQMKKRLSVNNPSENCFPIWAWYQWHNEKRKKPDLRHTGHLQSGELGYRIEFEVNADEVLLSDFVLFHHVLNRWYIPRDEKDDELFNKKLNLEEIDEFKLLDSLQDPDKVSYSKRLVEESWNNIFDLDWYDDYISPPKNEKSIQATLWELKLDKIKKVEAFIAR